MQLAIERIRIFKYDNYGPNLILIILMHQCHLVQLDLIKDTRTQVM